MKIIWSEQKAQYIKQEHPDRKYSFEDAARAIENGNILALIQNHKYPQEKIFILDIHSYPVAYPFQENNNEIFLKTLYPVRKYKKLL